jgi:hypothetical protein
MDLLTDESRILAGKQGQPVKLKKHLSAVAASFRRHTARLALPQSIKGLWKADLFLGSTVRDHWVGTTVKINPDHLEGERGLRIAIVPSLAGRSDAIRVDEQKNLVVCPMPHDGSFMETFYVGWRIVQALCAMDFNMPKEVLLPTPQEREVAKMWVERRDFPVVDVLEAMAVFAQPELLRPEEESVEGVSLGGSPEPSTLTVLTPFPSDERVKNKTLFTTHDWNRQSTRERNSELTKLLQNWTVQFSLTDTAEEISKSAAETIRPITRDIAQSARASMRHALLFPTVDREPEPSIEHTDVDDMEPGEHDSSGTAEDEEP